MKKRVQIFHCRILVITIASIKIAVSRFLENGFSGKINSIVGKNVFILKLREPVHFFFQFWQAHNPFLAKGCLCNHID